jgi:hypothetical protein
LVDVLEGDRRAEPGAAPAPPDGWRKNLAEVRKRLSILSPTEALDAVLEALDAIRVCARWPRAPERMANLEALRTLAATYEERCGEEREASTVAGLLRYFDAARRAVYIRSEMVASDDQHVTSDEESVTVCTYHKSKGLEWPVVVLASLDRSERRSAFDVLPQSDAAAFDAKDPLAGRWIHYWPWPFGAKKSLPLATYASDSPQGKDVALREEKERARLLYVGFTRARDHLVLAVPVRDNKGGPKPQTAWLDTLADSKGKPVLEVPTEATDGTVAPCVIRRADGTTLSVPRSCLAARRICSEGPRIPRHWRAKVVCSARNRCPEASVSHQPFTRARPIGPRSTWPRPRRRSGPWSAYRGPAFWPRIRTTTARSAWRPTRSSRQTWATCGPRRERHPPRGCSPPRG